MYRSLSMAILLSLAAAQSVAAQEFALSRGDVADSAALASSMPRLAAEVLATYRDADRARYVDNLFRLQLLTGRYAEASANLAELRASRTDTTPSARAVRSVRGIRAREESGGG